MFVCLGNICRSPLAHAIFQKMVDDRNLSDLYIVQSTGTCAYHAGEQSDSRMKATAADRGVDINHRARQIFRYDLDEFDYIFAMDKNNYKDVRSLTTNEDLLKHVYMFRQFDPVECGDVPDPYYGGQKGFDTVFDIADRTCRNILDLLEEDQI